MEQGHLLLRGQEEARTGPTRLQSGGSELLSVPHEGPKQGFPTGVRLWEPSLECSHRGWNIYSPGAKLKTLGSDPQQQ